MKIRCFQKGFNYSQDGRGNRLVLHLQGCNLRCPWCANPEGISPAGALMVDSDWLTAACCPRGAVQNGALDRAMCQACPDRPCTVMRQKGIRLSCTEIEVDDLLAQEGVQLRRSEGMNEARWIVLDYGTLLVHLFHQDDRAYYNLERLWEDGTNRIALPLEGEAEE